MDIPPPLAAPRVAAGALFVHGGGRVLLVRPGYKPTWEIPGGYVEPGESPRAACVREVREELGLDVAVGPLLVVDWAPTERDGDKLLFVFDGGGLTAAQVAAIRLQEDELLEHAFHDLPAAAALLDPRLHRRLTEALAVRASGGARYLEHGSTLYPQIGPVSVAA